MRPGRLILLKIPSKPLVRFELGEFPSQWRNDDNRLMKDELEEFLIRNLAQKYHFLKF